MSYLNVLRFPGGSDGIEFACYARDLSSIPGSGRSTGKGNGNPLRYSCLENPMDGRAWWATFHKVAKSWTWLSGLTFTYIPEWSSGFPYCVSWLSITSLFPFTVKLLQRVVWAHCLPFLTSHWFLSPHLRPVQISLCSQVSSLVLHCRLQSPYYCWG